jgi:hypothetical protein
MERWGHVHATFDENVADLQKDTYVEGLDYIKDAQ